MIELDDQDRICVVFLLNARVSLGRNKDFGCRIVDGIREDMVYTFALLIVIIVMMMVIALVMMCDGGIIMVMMRHKAMDQRKGVRQEG